MTSLNKVDYNLYQTEATFGIRSNDVFYHIPKLIRSYFGNDVIYERCSVNKYNFIRQGINYIPNKLYPLDISILILNDAMTEVYIIYIHITTYNLNSVVNFFYNNKEYFINSNKSSNDYLYRTIVTQHDSITYSINLNTKMNRIINLGKVMNTRYYKYILNEDNNLYIIKSV